MILDELVYAINHLLRHFLIFYVCLAQQFRVSKRLFKQMVIEIAPYMMSGAREGSVPYSVKLAITLRWLGGGSHYDLIDIFRVKKSTFFQIKDEVIVAINRAYKFEYDIDNVEQMNVIANGFKAKSTMGVIDKCCGALDGWAPVLQRPSTKEVANRKQALKQKAILYYQCPSYL